MLCRSSVSFGVGTRVQFMQHREVTRKACSYWAEAVMPGGLKFEWKDIPNSAAANREIVHHERYKKGGFAYEEIAAGPEVVTSDDCESNGEGDEDSEHFTQREPVDSEAETETGHPEEHEDDDSPNRRRGSASRLRSEIHRPSVSIEDEYRVMGVGNRWSGEGSPTQSRGTYSGPPPNDQVDAEMLADDAGTNDDYDNDVGEFVEQGQRATDVGVTVASQREDMEEDVVASYDVVLDQESEPSRAEVGAQEEVGSADVQIVVGSIDPAPTVSGDVAGVDAPLDATSSELPPEWQARFLKMQAMLAETTKRAQEAESRNMEMLASSSQTVIDLDNIDDDTLQSRITAMQEMEKEDLATVQEVLSGANAGEISATVGPGEGQSSEQGKEEKPDVKPAADLVAITIKQLRRKEHQERAGFLAERAGFQAELAELRRMIQLSLRPSGPTHPYPYPPHLYPPMGVQPLMTPPPYAYPGLHQQHMPPPGGYNDAGGVSQQPMAPPGCYYDGHWVLPQPMLSPGAYYDGRQQPLPPPAGSYFPVPLQPVPPPPSTMPTDSPVPPPPSTMPPDSQVPPPLTDVPPADPSEPQAAYNIPATVQIRGPPTPGSIPAPAQASVFPAPPNIISMEEPSTEAVAAPPALLDAATSNEAVAAVVPEAAAPESAPPAPSRHLTDSNSEDLQLSQFDQLLLNQQVTSPSPDATKPFRLEVFLIID